MSACGNMPLQWVLAVCVEINRPVRVGDVVVALEDARHTERWVVLVKVPHPLEAAVVGQPSERRGEQAVAFVVPNDNTRIDENELLKFIRSKLADYKVPKRVILSPALPRNATGKILKTELRKQLESE